MPTGTPRRVIGPVVLVVLIGLTFIVFRDRLARTESQAETAPANAHAPSFFTDISVSEAQQQAAADGSLLLVDATATWCGPCQMMERDTWPDTRIHEWFQNRGRAVQLDVDKDPATTRKLGIRAMPTLILFRGSKEVARKTGYMDADTLLQWLNAKAG